MALLKLKKSNVKNLKCKLCGHEFPSSKFHVCENCFGPLEVVYDFNSIDLNRRSFENRSNNLWRYHELLPIEDDRNIINLGAGLTKLSDCNNLAKILGIKKIYVKDDTLNPTGSFKDRPATVAVSKALEFGFKAVGCVSTGNLAAATAAHAAKAGMPCYVFIPESIEKNKILQASIYGAKIIAIKGTYDEANRLAAQACDEFEWGLVNINIRPYYVEGSKTLAFEICEQLEWNPPQNIIIPMASGALLCAIWKGLKQFRDLKLIEDLKTRIIGAQPEGCSPIVHAYKSNNDDITPLEKPKTIAKSLAIGDPSDGIFALKVMKESGGLSEFANDNEIIEGIRLLARSEGIFTEPAGGVTIAVLKKLIESGEIPRDEEVVCCITGSGFKSSETLLKYIQNPVVINPSIKELKNIIN